METKHTPGPWELDPPDMAHVTSEDYHVIRAGCGFLAESKEHREPGFSISGYMSPADARLIAAAPDLLAENAALRADLNDARSNWESGAEELRQADLVREQLVAALKAMLETQPNANDGRAGGHQSVTAEDVAACRQARAALRAAGVTP